MKKIKLSVFLFVVFLPMVIIVNACQIHAAGRSIFLYLPGMITASNVTNDLLFDSLINQTRHGVQIGGTFDEQGWNNDVRGHGMLIFDLGKTIQEGVIEFDVKGLSPDMSGGYKPGASKNRGYYFSLFDKPHGDKRMCYDGLAFIEVRLNIGYGYSSAIKLQSGTGTVPTSHYNVHCHPEYYIKEVLGRRSRHAWKPSHVYHHKVIFGEGRVQLFIDEQFEAESDYANKPVGWRYIYLGRNNYKSSGWNGPGSLIFSNLKVNGSE